MLARSLELLLLGCYCCSHCALAVIFCFPFIQIVYLSIFTFSCFLFVFLPLMLMFFCVFIVQHTTSSSSSTATVTRHSPLFCCCCCFFSVRNKKKTQTHIYLYSVCARWFSSFRPSAPLMSLWREKIGVEIVPAFEWKRRPTRREKTRTTDTHTHDTWETHKKKRPNNEQIEIDKSSNIQLTDHTLSWRSLYT